MTITSEPAGDRKAATSAGPPLPPLHAVPAQRSDAADGAVVRIDLGRPSEWALAVQPPGAQAIQPASLAGPFIRPLPRRFAIARVPDPADPRLGTAVLLYRRGQTLICCPGDQITERAASLLSALAGEALDLILDGGAPDQAPRMTFARIEHSLLPTDHRHIASAVVGDEEITFLVCARLISAELADVLGLLCTAHARDLLQLGRPGPDIRAVGRH